MINITTGISAAEQEGSFMNACLSGHGDIAISIAITPPERFEAMTEDTIAEQLKTDFAWLSEQGYEIEIQIGPEQDDNDKGDEE